MILAGDVGQLAVGDLRTCEVAGLGWSGNPAHLRSVAAALERAAQAWRTTSSSGRRPASRSPR